MKLELVLALIVLLAATSHAQLLCYHCDDCNANAAVVLPCGINNVITTPPQNPATTPGPPAGTTSIPPVPTTNGPILTPPLLPGTTSGGGLVTPPITPMSSTMGGMDFATPPITPKVEYDSHLLLPIPPSERQQHVCVMVRSTVGVVRRGCTLLESSMDVMCNSAFGGQHSRCTICKTHLCNTGT